MAVPLFAQDAIVSVTDHVDTGWYEVTRASSSSSVRKSAPSKDLQDVKAWISDGGIVTIDDGAARIKAQLRTSLLMMYRDIKSMELWQADPLRAFDCASELAVTRAQFAAIKKQYDQLP